MIYINRSGKTGGLTNYVEWQTPVDSNATFLVDGPTTLCPLTDSLDLDTTILVQSD